MLPSSDMNKPETLAATGAVGGSPDGLHDTHSIASVDGSNEYISASPSFSYPVSFALVTNAAWEPSGETWILRMSPVPSTLSVVTN